MVVTHTARATAAILNKNLIRFLIMPELCLMIMDATELKDAIAKYVAATSSVEQALATGTDLDNKASDGWSARMVVHHLADSETSSYSRLRSLLAEKTPPTLIGYDEGNWAITPSLGYESSDIKNSLAVYKSVRTATADVLNRLTVSDLAKEGIHTERGKYTVQDWLRIYSKHPTDHAEQIVKAFKGLA